MKPYIRLFNEHFFQEKIPLSIARKYIKDWNKERLFDWFDGKYRVYLPIGESKAVANDLKNDLKNEIEDSLKISNFEIVDYIKGIAYDIKNNRNIKIGKVLNKINKELLQKYVNDVSRGSSKIEEPIVVISRHPYDIAGQSFDRGWTSCKDMGGKDRSNVNYVADEVHSSLIAYLIYKNDKNINRPIARILITQYYNSKGEQAYIPQVTQYGTAGIWRKAFADTVQKWLDSKQGRLVGIYKINAFQYADSLATEYNILDIMELPDWVQKSKNVPANFSYKNNTFIWEKGTWKSGTWKDGIWKDGIWKNGLWERGIWKDGIWKDGIWKNGLWERGTWENGTWERGTWEDGFWGEGTWKDGIWDGGWIYDPNRVGNFESDWKWEKGYVKSPISPKEYFQK